MKTLTRSLIVAAAALVALPEAAVAAMPSSVDRLACPTMSS